MPLNHDDATVSVHVTGVSLGLVNPNTKKWEVSFVRVPDHTLTLEIIKIWSGHPNEVIYGPKTIEPNRVFIEAFKPVHRDTEIADLSESDPENFNLLVDIEKFVYRRKKLRLKKPTRPISEMIVSNARLYSVEGMTSPFKVIVFRTDSGTDLRQLEKIGTTAGADIPCKPGGKVVLRIDEWEKEFPKEDGTRYVVWFDNRCPPAKKPDSEREASASTAEFTEITKLDRVGQLKVIPHSDFVLFYNLLDPENKGKFDLIKVRADGVFGEGAVCNYGNMGESDFMFPLPIT